MPFFKIFSEIFFAKPAQFLYVFSGTCIPFHMGLFIFIQDEGALSHLVVCLSNKRGSTAQRTYLQHTKIFFRSTHNSPSFCIFNNIPLLFVKAFNYRINYLLFLFISFCIFICYCSVLSKLLPCWLVFAFIVSHKSLLMWLLFIIIHFIHNSVILSKAI